MGIPRNQSKLLDEAILTSMSHCPALNVMMGDMDDILEEGRAVFDDYQNE